MKTTRNLFLLVGSPPNVISALNELNFKGLITNPYWTPINEANVNEAFECNKSIVCAADDYVGKSPPEAIKINVEDNNFANLSYDVTGVEGHIECENNSPQFIPYQEQ